MMEYLFLIFTFQQHKIWHFTFHMYAFYGLITMAKHAVKHSIILDNLKMCCDIVIILREW